MPETQESNCIKLDDKISVTPIQYVLDLVDFVEEELLPAMNLDCVTCVMGINLLAHARDFAIRKFEERGLCGKEKEDGRDTK